MDNTTASMAIRIDAEVSSAITGLKKVEKQLDSLVPGGQAVANVFQRIQFGMLQIVQGTVRNSLVGITSAMKGMVSSGVKVAETLESAAVGFETVLRSGEDVNALLLDIQKNAVKTPFDVDALTLSTQKMALITKNGAQAERVILNMGKALAAAGRGTAELNRMATNLQQIGTNAFVSARDIREFGNAGIDINRIVSEFSETFKQTGKDATEVTDWLKEIDDPFSVIVNAINAAGESTEGFAEVYEKGAQTIKQANENMSDSVAIFSYRVLEQAKVLDKVKNVFSELQNNLFLDETFTANTIEAIRHFIEMIDELDIIRPIIDGIKRAVSAFATGQFDNVIVFFKELFNAIKQFSGIQMITNAFKVLLDLFSDNHTAEEVKNVANQIGTLVRYFLELKFALSVTNYLANFAGTIIRVGMAVSEAVPSIINFVRGLSTMSAGGLKFVAVAALIIGAIILVQNFGDQIAEVFSNIGQFFADLGKSIGNLVKDFATFGYNIMAGLWNGIAEGAKAVFEQVKNIAVGIKNIFKSIFRIASPSKVMRDEIGRYIDEGIAEGITMYYGDIASASEDVLSKLVEMQAEYVKELGDFGALDLVQQVKVYKDFANLYAKGTKARWEMDQKVHDAETAIVKEMINLIDDYNKAWDKAYLKAKDYYDMFEYTQATLTRTTASVIEGLSRQNDNLTKYYNNIAKMSKMGFDSNFMEYIYEQGLDAASEVAGLADATAEEIEEINNLWATRGKVAADIATLNTKKLKEDTLDELDYLQSGLETKVLNYYETGTYLDYNFARGIYDMMPTVQDAVEAVNATASGTSGAADKVKDAVDGLGDAVAGLEDLNLTPDLQKLEIQAFDTANAFDLLKNMLAGIPWQIWAVAVGILAYKIWDMFQNIQRDVPKAVHGLGQGMQTLIQSLNDGVQRLVDSMENMLTALETKIGKVSAATYNSAREISNYESVYRQSMQGVLAVTDEGTSNIIDMIDFAKSQGTIKTQDATKAIGDIMHNGIENISDDTRKTLNNIEDAFGVTINNTEHVIEKGLQTIDYNARDIYDQVIYDATHKTENLANNIVGTLDAGTQRAGMSIIGNMEDALNTTDRDFKVAVKRFTQDFDDIDDIVADVMADAVATTELSAQKIENAFGKATQHTISYTQDVENTIAETSRQVTRTTDNMSRSMASSVSAGTNKVTKSVSSMASKARSGVSKLSGVLGGVSGMLAGINPKLASTLDSWGDTINNGMSTIDNSIIGKTSQIVGTVENTLDRSKSGFRNKLVGIGDTVTKSTSDIGKNVKKEVSNIETTTLKQTDGMKSKLGSKIVSVAQNIGQTITGVLTAIVKTITDFLGNVVDEIMNVLTKITSGIGRAIKGLLEPLSDGKLLIGAGVLVVLSASILILANACKALMEVDWESIGKLAVVSGIVLAIAGVVGLLGQVAEYILVGAIALAAAGVAFGVATAAIGIGLSVLATCLQTASEIGAQIQSDGLLAIMGALALVGSLLTLMTPLLAIGAIAGAFATVLSTELLITVLALNAVSTLGANIDLAGIQNLMLAIMGVSSMMTLMGVMSIAGAVMGVFAVALSGELLVIATALRLASALGAGIVTDNLENIGKGVKTVSDIFLSIGLLGGAFAAITGVFATVVSGEALIIATALRVASDLGTGINQDNLWNIGNGVHTMSDIFLSIGLLGGAFAAMTGVFASVVSVEALVIAAALRAASDLGEGIVEDNLKNVGNGVHTVSDIFLSIGVLGAGWAAVVGAFATVTSVELMIIAKALGEACEHAAKIKPTALLYIGQCVKILNSIDFGDFWQNWGNAGNSSIVKDVAKNVDEIVTYLMDAVNKVAEMQKVTEQKVTSYMLHIGLILQVLSTYNFGEKDAVNEKREVSEKLSAMTENVDKIIGTVHEIVSKLADLSSKVGRGQAEKYVEQAKEIVSKLSDFELSDEGGGWFSQSKLDKTKEAAGKIAEVSTSVSNIMNQVKSIVDILAEFSKNGISSDTVHNYIEDTKKIIDQFAEIKPSQEVEDATKENVSKIGEVSSNVSTIMTSTKNIVETLKALEEQGVTPETAQSYVEKSNGIIAKFGELALPGKEDGAYEALANNTQHVANATTHVNDILRNAKDMVDLVAQYEEAIKDKNVDEMVQNINEMIAQITGGTAYAHGGNTWHQGIKLPDDRIFTENDVATYEAIKNVLAHIKEIAETINNVPDTANKIGGVEAIVNFIKETLAKLPETVKTYADDMKGIGESFAKKFQEGWESVYPDLTEAGYGAQNALWTALESKMEDEYKQGQALAGKVVEGVKNVYQDMKSAGEGMQGELWGGIQNKFSDEYKQGQALSGQVIDGIWSKQGDWWWTGDNIVAGVAGGINRNMWQISNAAGNISQTAITKLKQLLDIHSPSRVMAGLGGNVAEGFADGIIDNLTAVEEAGEALAEAVMDSYNDTIEPINLTAFEARNAANTERAAFGGTTSRTTSVVQNNNIYNGMDMASALSDIAWAVSRS